MKIQFIQFLNKQIIYDEDIDFQKIKQIYSPGYISSIDVELLMYVLQKINCIYTYDVFVIDIFELHILMDTINKYFNIKLNSKIDLYSIFIVL